MMRVDDSPLLGRGVTGVGSVYATPCGSTPNHEPVSSTADEKPSIEVTIHVLVPLVFCRIINDDGLHAMKKSDTSESLATLLTEDSSIHTSPDASTTTSLGRLPAANVHSVNWPVLDIARVLAAGVTTTVEGNTGPATWVKIASAIGSDRAMVGVLLVTIPPVDGSSVATLSPPRCVTQGFPVSGLTLMPLGSASAVGTCHSVKVLSLRNTPT